MPKPWEKYATQSGPWAKYGLTPVGPADDLHPLKVRSEQIGVQKGEQDLTDAPTMHAIHAEQLRQERLKSQTAQEAYDAEHKPLAAPSNVHGDDFLKTLAPEQASMVKALATGRMAFPTGKAAASPYFQDLLNKVASYDPEFDAVNYGSRFATRKDFTSGKGAQNIRALNTAIGHLGHLAGQIDGTASHEFTPFNAAQNAATRIFGGAGPGNYDQTSTALAGELTAVYRGSGGAEADIKRYIDQLSPNASLEQKKATIGNIVGLLDSRLNALSDQYKQGMGTTAEPLRLLDPQAQQIVSTYAPKDGGGAPPPPTGPGNPGPITPATGATMHDADKSAMLDHFVRAGVPYEQAAAQLGAFGDKHSYDTAVAYAAKHKDYQGSYGDVVKPTGVFNRAINSGPGIAITDALNTAAGGLPVALGGEQAQLGQAAGDAAHPYWAGGGKFAGLVGGSLGLTKALGALGATKGAGLGASLIQGYSNGATESPDDAVAGGIKGMVGMAAGEGVGRFALAPAMRGIAGTKPVANAIDFLSQKMGGNGFSPVAPLGNAQAITARALPDKAFADVTGKLQQASDLGLPYSPADASPKLRALLGSAVRKNPDVRNLAESVLAPRHAGQGERALSLIDQHLAPTSDITDLLANSKKAAQAASKPLYDKAMQAPPVNDPQISELLNTPGGAKAARQGYDNMLNAGQSPGELSMSLDPVSGQPRYDASINWPTLQGVKRGMDQSLEQARDPITQKLDLTNPANQGLDKLRKAYASRLGQLNPDYAAADSAYANIRGQGTAAQQGYGATTPKMTPTQTGQLLQGLKADYVPNFQQGYASNMADRIVAQGRGNPYDLVNGSMGQKAKLDTVFPQGAGQFHTAHALEGDMARTNQEALGGSATQPRAEADKQFEDSGMVGHATDLGLSVLTGQPNLGMLTKLARNTLPDAWRLGMGSKAASKAADIAPSLLNTDPSASLAALNALMKQKAERDAYVKMFGQAGGAAGSAAGGGLFLSQN